MTLYEIRLVGREGESPRGVRGSWTRVYEDDLERAVVRALKTALERRRQRLAVVVVTLR